MAERVLQLVLHYDGTDFAGWQVQRAERTVQGVIEAALARLNEHPVRIAGAGRTDAGVHARGQVASVRLPLHWSAEKLKRVLNEQLPDDVWVEQVHEMQSGFHARYSATDRRYSYAVGLDEMAHSPFRRRWEYALPRKERALDREALNWCAERMMGMHRFLGFAVRGTAPATDDHRCDIRRCKWRETPGGIALDIEANRFLHHMVRFLVGTMLDVADGRRAREEFTQLLEATTNDEVSPPAPPQGLCLEHVTYPHDLYLTPTTA
jgi:tRNA pseudouridine38-40 synthase